MRRLQRHWFLICLLLTFVVGTAWAELFQPIADLSLLRQLVVATVMFVMAWPLETRVIWKTIRRPWAAILATLVNFGLLPLLAPWFGAMLSTELAAGLMVAAATPCTLASAAVWTRRGGGNDTAAIMTTVLTNLACFVVTPLWVAYLLGEYAEGLALGSLVGRLLILVVLPMSLAQLTRVARPIANWSTSRKTGLSVWAQIGILFMTLVGAVRTADQFAGEFNWVSAITLIVVCGSLHLSVLAAGWQLARLSGLSPADQIAVAFAGSQKTLMVGLVVCMQVGVSLLPMVVFHAVQLILDTPISDWFKARPTKNE